MEGVPVSYALVNVATAQVVQQYGDTPPSLVVWPNGDSSHCPVLGDERAGIRFVQVVTASELPNEFYRKTGTSHALSGATVTAANLWSPVDLASAQATLLTRIDLVADDLIYQHAKKLPMPQHPMIAWQMLTEAKACVADPAPLAGSYPLLSTAVSGTATLAGVAQTFTQAASAWTIACVKIQRTRLATKAAVRAAVTVDDAVAAFGGADWP